MKTPPADPQLECWNAQKSRDLRAHTVTQCWLLVTPMECEALLDGVVSASIQGHCRTLLRTEVEGTRDPVWEASQP